MGGEEQDPDQEGPPESDPRARLLGERVTRSLRVESDRWARCAASPEAQQLLRAFLDGDPAERLLFAALVSAGQLVLAEQLPLAAAPRRPSKGVFLLRTAPGPLSCPPAPGHLLWGDLSPSLLDHLAVLMEEAVRAQSSFPADLPEAAKKGREGEEAQEETTAPADTGTWHKKRARAFASESCLPVQTSAACVLHRSGPVP
uniref:Uncharacterized protein n=1 Tax=Sphaerodactylus townsendi TaxID=933632 RepID=A0ACB8EJW7_9SAUR